MSSTPKAAAGVEASRVPTGDETRAVTPTPKTSTEKENINEKLETVAANNGSDTNRDVETGTGAAVDPESRYVTGKKLFLIFVAFLVSIFLVALDQTIVATAIPKIVSDFNALSEISWIASGYFLTQAGCMLTAGQFLTIAPTKWIYIIAIALFEIGSLFCAVATSIEFLIFGRAFAGVGAAAIFIAVLSVIAEITRLEQRPVLFGAFGAVFALSSVVGPLLGGAFSDHVSWRWCFYINLPFGVIAIGGVLLWLKARPPPHNPRYDGWTTFQKWIAVDWIGSFVCLGMVTCLLLPLQWGGNEKEWNDPVVIALLCVFGVVLVIFIAWEYHMREAAIMPLKMFRRRTQAGTCLEAFFVMLALLVGIYYLPFFYQAKGRSATKSGIDILPFMLSTIIGSAVSGGIINFTGRYWIFLFASPFLICVGCGLLYTIDYTTPNAKLIGYQIIYGFGVGGALQNVIIAIQAEFADNEAMVPQATSLVTFIQLIGGILGISISGTIFANQLKVALSVFGSDLPPEVIKIVRQSVTVIFQLPPEQQRPVIDAYINALNYVFILGVPCGALASASSFLIKSYNLKERSSTAMMAMG